MRDLRKSSTEDKKSGRTKFNPFKWLNRNRSYLMLVLSGFIIFNIIFNPGGVSNFISSWLSDFLNNWKV
jgi:hypothetical protein